MEDIKHYQDLTFEVLDKLIKEECKKGNSKLFLIRYHMGEKMKKYLKNKGFMVYLSIYGTYHCIEW